MQCNAVQCNAMYVCMYIYIHIYIYTHMSPWYPQDTPQWWGCSPSPLSTDHCRSAVPLPPPRSAPVQGICHERELLFEEHAQRRAGSWFLKVDRHRRVPGCRPGRGVSGCAVPRWYRWCLGSVSVVSWWCLGGVLEILPKDIFKRACVGILSRDHL